MCARDGSTKKDTRSPVNAPTVTSMTRSIAEPRGLRWLRVGTSSTITAVTVAALRLGLMAAIKASGATASTSKASNPASPEYGMNTAMAPP
ncbi:hypothetical protein GALL_539730 [mine drainage metagenome]|uniref:Uncharacterized protein n=1 Tax=mine drainage metagenome TaxID=410659 RepID=A0A1J5PLR2_9ZZZZ